MPGSRWPLFKNTTAKDSPVCWFLNTAAGLVQRQYKKEISFPYKIKLDIYFVFCIVLPNTPGLKGRAQRSTGTTQGGRTLWWGKVQQHPSFVLHCGMSLQIWRKISSLWKHKASCWDWLSTPEENQWFAAVQDEDFFMSYKDKDAGSGPGPCQI